MWLTKREMSALCLWGKTSVMSKQLTVQSAALRTAGMLLFQASTCQFTALLVHFYNTYCFNKLLLCIILISSKVTLIK